MIGIITGIERCDFVDGPALIKLTREERWEYLKACVKSILTNKSQAECMSPKLESLLCGGRPERYIKC